jgi:hypothetical protein
MEHESNRNRLWQRIAFTGLIACLLGLVLTGAETVPLPDSVSPCLPCHNGGAGGQIGEWLASPYSESAGGRGCIDCHEGDCSGNGVAPTRSGIRKNLDRVRLREALLLRVTASRSGETVDVEVAVANVGAGHLLPSSSGERNLILEVAARDRQQELMPWPAGTSHLQLSPFATDISRYRFASQDSGMIHVSARLVLASRENGPLEIANTTTICLASGESP